MTIAAEINPGKGYLTRELLGRGKWKEVYRAVFRGEWHDRALLRFIVQPSADELLQELEPLQALITHPPENVAQIYGVFKGDDGHIYIVEELLYRSLKNLTPVTTLESFLLISRDLSRGLRDLHSRNIIHRDLKLDNCGVDHAGRAKIFDLGLATSEGREPRGTILTRAPEIFKDSLVNKQSDVWALGATLFAVRTGEYPFVHSLEIGTRPSDGSERRAFDDKIKSRAMAPNAEQTLQERVSALLPKEVTEVLIRLLAFDPSKRLTMEEAVTEWERLIKTCLRPSKPRAEGQNPDQRLLTELTAFLLAASKREIGLTARQWERAVMAVEGLRKNLGDEATQEVQTLLNSVKELREQGKFP